MTAEPVRRSRRVATSAVRLGKLVDQVDRGATATEYALLVAFIAIAIALAVGLFGTDLSSFYNTITTKVSSYL